MSVRAHVPCGGGCCGQDLHLEEEEGEGSEEDEYQRSVHKLHRININKFTEAMEFVDTQLKSLPATAQVRATPAQ